ncbi:MAG: amidohydrolase [Clostridia bacterium]|nr:amidohydrolase [Clostridia bacterium]
MNNQLIIINAEIITMEEADYKCGFLLVNDGIIEKIGDMAELLNISDDVKVIDAKGKLVTPGLIDAHSHIGMWEDSINFEGDDGNEDTDPASPQLRAIDGVNPQDRAFDEAVSAGVTTVVTGPGSANPLGGQLLAMKTYGICVDDMVIKEPIGIKAAFGENPKSVYHEKSETPVTRMGTASIIREALFKAKNYMEQLEKSEKDEDEDKPDWDFKNETLLPLLRGEIPLHAHAHRLDDIFTAIRISKEFGLKLILVHGTEAYLAADKIAKENIPVLAGPVLTDRSKPELRNQAENSAYVLIKAGIPTAIITDHPETPQKFLSLCAGIGIKAGLSFKEALWAITKAPAEICGLSDKVGSLKAGKDADIVIWDGSPAELTGKPEYVIAGGKIV